METERIDKQEAMNEQACYEAAGKAGYPPGQAESCEDGEFKCPECPFDKNIVRLVIEFDPEMPEICKRDPDGVYLIELRNKFFIQAFDEFRHELRRWLIENHPEYEELYVDEDGLDLALPSIGNVIRHREVHEIEPFDRKKADDVFTAYRDKLAEIGLRPIELKENYDEEGRGIYYPLRDEQDDEDTIIGM